MKKILLISCLVLLTPLAAQGQNVPYSDITLSSRGTPVGGAPIAVCNNPGLSTTAAQVISNIAVLTMSSNPITAGFVANQAISVSGFTGADTYFNGGTVTSTGITNNFLILSVTATQITYALTHANASATTNGSVFQAGSQAQACAPLASIFSDPAGLSPITQPGFTSTGLGNYQFYAVGSTAYYVQFYGATIGEILKPILLPCGGNATCTFSGQQNLATVAVSGAGTTCTIVAAPNGAAETGNTVTITTTAVCPIAVTNNWVNLDGIGPSGGILQYNGPYQVLSGSGGTSFTVFNSKTSLANSGGGTVSLIPLAATGGPASDVTTNAGTFDNANFYVFGLRQTGGCNFQSAYYNVNGNRRNTTPFATCLQIPATSTQAQGDAFASVVQNFSGASTAATAFLGVAENDSNNGRTFGGGFVVNDNAFTCLNCVAQENDVGWSNAGTRTIGLNLVSFGATTSLAQSAGLWIQNNTPGTPANGWPTGIRVDIGSSLAPQLNGTTCQAGLCLLPLSTGSSQASQGIALQSTSSGGSALLSTWSEDLSGNNQFNVPNAHVFNVAGVTKAQVTSAGVLGAGTVGCTGSATCFAGSVGSEFAGIYMKNGGAISGATGDVVCGGVTSSLTLNCSYNNDGASGAGFPVTRTIGTGNVTTAGTAINTLTCQAQTAITVTGAQTTDNVVANIGAALPATWQTGIAMQAHVTATNTVTVYLCNPTATATITPAATQVNVRVTR